MAANFYNIMLEKKLVMNTKIQGFNLFEVMIALVIFSIGLLGLASLQTTGLKLSHDSMLRSIAQTKAMDMADRIRSNQAAADLGTTSPYNNPTGSETGIPACIGKNSTGGAANTQCTAAQMASQDFYDWNSQIQGRTATAWHPAYSAALPNGQGIVCIDSTPDDGTAANPQCDGILTNPNNVIFTIKMWWTERKDEDNPNATTRRFTTNFAL